MKKHILLLVILATTSMVYAQFDEKKLSGTPQHVTEPRVIQLDEVVPTPEEAPALPPVGTSFQARQLSSTSLLQPGYGATIRQLSSWGIPEWVEGPVPSLKGQQYVNPEEAALAYLRHNQSVVPADELEENFRVIAVEEESELNMTHVKLQQYRHDIPVFGGEVWVHIRGDQPASMTGRLFPVWGLAHEIVHSQDEAEATLRNHFRDEWSRHKPDIKGYNPQQIDLTLQWYPLEDKKEIIPAYVGTVYPDFMHRYFIVINAATLEIIESHKGMCYIHGDHDMQGHAHHANCQHGQANHSTTATTASMVETDEAASGQDLLGINRNFRVARENGVYYMIDISRDMYNSSASSIPNNPVGAIRTLDGLGNPFQGSINYNHVSSNNNTWNDRATVSAHFNAGQAYEYFLNTFNRNSINGSGGTVISFVHVADENGQAMDNAFWNGQAMFYGDGNQGFFPLARSLDVAGHEIAHGVVQNTANLVYQDEPGALNESFADVFGTMIDRDDWKIGEDVVKPSAFPSGALRDMQDPTQGFSSLNQPGYQPAHYSDRYTGSQDNGGVHINSGIPNRAFYLFATAVGKAKAEQVYYRALSTYLTRTSRFSTCRAAVMQAAKDLYGNTECQAAADAFSQVGISGSNCSTNTTDPTDNTELPINPGDDFLVVSNASSEQPWLIDDEVNILLDPLANQVAKSKPSVSDDGSRIVFVNGENEIYFVEINWSTFQVVDSRALTTSGEWRNVAISKDGQRLAAVRTNPENVLVVFELSTGNGLEFTLTNPTTADGIATGDVLYCDAMEWDYSGNFVIYDAVNEIAGTSDNIQYWDIGILRAYNRQGESFGDGNITKLFSGLPEGISIGNPVLSKTKPNVIAFDLLRQDFFGDQNELWGSNIETNTSKMIFENNTVSYPSYSRTDDRIVFNFNNGQTRSIGNIRLMDDKISPDGQATLLLDGGYWANWFGNGARNIYIGTNDEKALQDVRIKPNPVSDFVDITFGENVQDIENITMSSIDGKLIERLEVPAGQTSVRLDMCTYAAGIYMLKLKTTAGTVTRKLIKQ